MNINHVNFGQQYGAVNPFNPNVGSNVNIRRPQVPIGGEQNINRQPINNGNPFAGKSAGEIDFNKFQAYKENIVAAAAAGAATGINPFQPVTQPTENINVGGVDSQSTFAKREQVTRVFAPGSIANASQSEKPFGYPGEARLRDIAIA